jgi:hypothetical protein
MTAQERLKIAENIVARVGLDGDIMGEFARAMAGLNEFDSFQQMAPPPQQPMGGVPNIAENGDNMPQEGMGMEAPPMV